MDKRRDRPNILLIMTDQQAERMRKSRGYPLDTMPFLDALAGQGVQFTSAYTANPTCMPARVSLFTGRYPSCHQVKCNAAAPAAFYSKDMLDVVKEAGYRTALCGKNHSHRRPEDFDFCRQNTHWGATDPKREGPSQKSFDRFLCSLDNGVSMGPSPGGTEEQLPYRNVSDALEFIDSADPRPFFLWLSFAEPHNPYQVPTPYFNLFPPDLLPASTPPCAGKGVRFSWLRAQWETLYGKERCDAIIRRCRSNYLGMLRLIDDQIRRLMGEMEKRGLQNDTIVVFLSDHGDFAGEYGLVRKGADLPEALVRIPMIWKGPGIEAKGDYEGCFANIVDVLPTLCDALRVPVPAGVQGESLWSVLTGRRGSGEPESIAYSETGYGGDYWSEEDGLPPVCRGVHKEGAFDCLNSITQSGQVRMVRKGQWKLQYDMRAQGHLYDLSTDPFEEHDLWCDPRFEKNKYELLEALAQKCLELTDTLPVPPDRFAVKRFPQSEEKGGDAE